MPLYTVCIIWYCVDHLLFRHLINDVITVGHGRVKPWTVPE